MRLDPLLTVMVPTIGRPTLKRTLASIRQQDADFGYEVVIVGDHFEGLDSRGHLKHELVFAQECAKETSCTYLAADTGRHDFSHSNRQAALSSCTGEWLVVLDDDDIFSRNALVDIGAAIGAQAEPRPLMFKMQTHWGEMLWDLPRLKRGRMGTGNFVTPLITGRLGRWGLTYEGDFDFIESTLAHYQDTPEWRSEVMTICRPSSIDDWTRVTS